MKTMQKAWMVAFGVMMLAAFSGGLRAEDSPLTLVMESINKNVKKLRKDIKDSSLNAASATMARECVDLATKARELMPAKVKDIPAGEREKFIEEYKKMMGELISIFTDLEKALKDNKNDAAEEIYAKLLDMKKKGHDKFTE